MFGSQEEFDEQMNTIFGKVEKMKDVVMRVNLQMKDPVLQLPY
jgi:arsenite-transporting ATPase